MSYLIVCEDHINNHYHKDLVGKIYNLSDHSTKIRPYMTLHDLEGLIKKVWGDLDINFRSDNPKTDIFYHLEIRKKHKVPAYVMDSILGAWACKKGDGVTEGYLELFLKVHQDKIIKNETQENEKEAI